MASEKLVAVYEKLLPVVVGALLGVVPVITNTALQARTTRSQVLLTQRLSSIREFSTACARRVQVVKSVVFLSNVSDRGPWAPDVERRILDRYELLDRELSESSVALQAQMDVANALFDTKLRGPDESEVGQLPLTSEEIRREGNARTEIISKAIPSLAQQCLSSTQTLTAKLND